MRHPKSVQLCPGSGTQPRCPSSGVTEQAPTAHIHTQVLLQSTLRQLIMRPLLTIGVQGYPPPDAIPAPTMIPGMHTIPIRAMRFRISKREVSDFINFFYPPPPRDFVKRKIVFGCTLLRVALQGIQADQAPTSRSRRRVLPAGRILSGEQGVRSSRSARQEGQPLHGLAFMPFADARGSGRRVHRRRV